MIYICWCVDNTLCHMNWVCCFKVLLSLYVCISNIVRLRQSTGFLIISSNSNCVSGRSWSVQCVPPLVLFFHSCNGLIRMPVAFIHFCDLPEYRILCLVWIHMYSPAMVSDCVPLLVLFKPHLQPFHWSNALCCVLRIAPPHWPYPSIAYTLRACITLLCKFFATTLEYPWRVRDCRHLLQPLNRELLQRLLYTCV